MDQIQVKGSGNTEGVIIIYGIQWTNIEAVAVSQVWHKLPRLAAQNYTGGILLHCTNMEDVSHGNPRNGNMKQHKQEYKDLTLTQWAVLFWLGDKYGKGVGVNSVKTKDDW